MTPPPSGRRRDLWVFGYGSLMWRPGFSFTRRQSARLYGYHRAFCIFSHVYRGTPQKPGLVLGLDAGGSCRGMAFRVAADRADKVIAYLRRREQPTMIYQERLLPVRLTGHARPVQALCFVVDRAHHQYACSLSLDEQVRLIRQGHGRGGDNRDYLWQTVQHLIKEGMADKNLIRLWKAVESA